MTKHPAVEALRKAAKGLLFPSDSDAKMEPFLWEETGDKLTDTRLRELSGAETGTPVETVTLDDFFRAVPAEDLPKFDKLAAAIHDQLSDVAVYKLGDEAEKEVYVAGKTKDGKWAGLKTTVVET